MITDHFHGCVHEGCILPWGVYPVVAFTFGFEDFERKPFRGLRHGVRLHQLSSLRQSLRRIFKCRLPANRDVLQEIAYPNSSPYWMRRPLRTKTSVSPADKILAMQLT